ncbi:MAG: TetR/AcrR family transcriptional regulator [Actinobacteria bacterium]|nr:TetR/AcrR family transcriptional regulator [Actinomycetota bacterium]
MPEEPPAWLRKQPRQQRAIDRVEALLDTAEATFGELGYDNTTTNLIADRAGIPVATLYRWFPDKAAMAEGLAARYLNRLADSYAVLIVEAPPRSGLLRRAVHDLARLVKESPALPAIVAAATSSAGGALRETLHGGVALTIRSLVPTVADSDLERIADMLTTITIAVLGSTMYLEGAEYDAAVDEFSNLVVAWMTARFPPEGDPIWDLVDPLVTPLAPSPPEFRRHDVAEPEAGAS